MPTQKRIPVAVASDAESGAAFVVARVANLLHSVRGKRPVLGLATGRSVAPIYAALVEAFARRELDPKALVTFNLDEYVGLPADHPASFRHWMREALFDPAGIPRGACHFPDAVADGDGSVDAPYERAIREAGGIDVQLLGIGVNGHIAFNEPGAARSSRTRRVRLAAETLRENHSFFDGLGAMPEEAITVGIATILETRSVLLVAWGDSKAEALRRAFVEPVSAECPASYLQEHPGDVELVLDVHAARALESRLIYA